MLIYGVGLNSNKQMSDGINKQFSLLNIDHFDYPFVFNSSKAFYHCTRGPSSCVQQRFQHHTLLLAAFWSIYPYELWWPSEFFLGARRHQNSSLVHKGIFCHCLSWGMSAFGAICAHCPLCGADAAKEKKETFCSDVGLCSVTSASAVQCCFIPSVCCMCHLLNSVIILADLWCYY